MNVVDCTLRDGGYYNEWDFDTDLVQKYLDSMHRAGVNVVEIGFRFPQKNKFFGAFAHASDDVINIQPGFSPSIAVMINAFDFLDIDLSQYFSRKEDSCVSIVRIAMHFKHLEHSLSLSKKLKDLGYKIGLNLMQASERSEAELMQFAQLAKEQGSVDILYLADSLGDFNEQSIKRAFSMIKSQWNGSLGFHAHNNKGLALKNSLYALESMGVEWIDSTVLGMGRGAGNTETEYLLIELSQKGYDYKPEALYALVAEDFEPLRKKYGWGPSLAYYLSASLGIHPTYVQEMLAHDRYDRVVFNRLEFLKTMGGLSFNRENLSRSRYGNFIDSEGQWCASGWARDRDVLIIAPGQNGLRHFDFINKWKTKNDAISIGLNAVDDNFDIDIYAICHYLRLDTDLPKLCAKKKPILIPFNSIPQDLHRLLDNCTILDYGIKIVDNYFTCQPDYCCLPVLLVAPYAIAAAIIGEAKRILLVGFDGYESNDSRYNEMDNLFAKCLEKFPHIYAVTPTNYKTVPQRSIYCI